MRGAVLLCLSMMMVVAVMLACSGGAASSQQVTDASNRIVAALCDARAQVGEGAAAVESIFVDRAHDPLHDLARDSVEINRAVAARLLEAKQAVEAAFETARSKDALTVQLDSLIDATRRAVEAATGSAVAGCRDGVGDD